MNVMQVVTLLPSGKYEKEMKFLSNISAAAFDKCKVAT